MESCRNVMFVISARDSLREQTKAERRAFDFWPLTDSSFRFDRSARLYIASRTHWHLVYSLLHHLLRLKAGCAERTTFSRGEQSS